MKKYLIICCVLMICGLKNVVAQSFPDPPVGTKFTFYDDGTTNGLTALIEFANHEVVAPADGINAVVTYAAIEIVGIDANNDEIPIIAIGTSFTNQWNGLDYVNGIGSSTNPAIVTVKVILLAQYNDPINGDYEEEMDYEYDPSSATFPINIGN